MENIFYHVIFTYFEKIKFIRVLQNATQVGIDKCPFILVLDLVHVIVHRPKKALVYVFRWGIKMTTFCDL